MKTIKQLVWRKREDGDAGGVPKFAWYLQRAIGGAVYSCTNGGNSDWSNSLPIVDGNLSRWIGDIPIISIVHGTWKEFALRNGNPPFTIGEVEEQNREWNRKNIVCVAVSPASERQLKKHHGVTAKAMILNPVDHDLYVPKRADNKVPVVIYVANDANKGGQRMHEVPVLLKGKFEFRYLNARPGEEHLKFVTGDLYMHPSRYEGNSFACLEAMSCNLPGVYTKCGLMEDMDSAVVGEIVPWDAPSKVLADALVRVWENKGKYNPRAWIEKNATFSIFKNKWLKFIEPYIK